MLWKWLSEEAADITSAANSGAQPTLKDGARRPGKFYDFNDTIFIYKYFIYRLIELNTVQKH